MRFLVFFQAKATVYFKGRGNQNCLFSFTQVNLYFFMVCVVWKNSLLASSMTQTCNSVLKQFCLHCWTFELERFWAELGWLMKFLTHYVGRDNSPIFDIGSTMHLPSAAITEAVAPPVSWMRTCLHSVGKHKQDGEGEPLCSWGQCRSCRGWTDQLARKSDDSSGEQSDDDA